MDWKKAIQLAAVYVGSVVGAGFATGKEIVEFFSRYGSFGLLTIIIAGLAFIWFGVKIMLLAIRLDAESYHKINVYLFGPWLTPVINGIMFLMLIGVTSVMLAGAGSVFEEQLHLSKNLGVYLTIILAFIILLVGTRGLFLVNTIVVPCMILFSLLLFGQVLMIPDFWQVTNAPMDFQWKAILSAFGYSSFNITLTLAVIVPAAREIGNEKTVKLGGIIGGTVLTLLLMVNHLIIIQLPNFQIYDIPMAVMMEKFAVSLHFLFILVIYGEIFTSIIGNIYGLERFIQKIVPIRTAYVGFGIFSIAFFVSKINYGTLLSTLYPLFGYIALCYLFLLLIKK